MVTERNCLHDGKLLLYQKAIALDWFLAAWQFALYRCCHLPQDRLGGGECSRLKIDISGN
jgi:hypothetical protein